MAPPITTDRVKRISIEPYDQVFALTQWIINSGLETKWLELCKDDEDMKKPLILTQPGAGSIYGAIVNYPRIVVQTGYTEDLSSVLYLMCFSKGTFKLEIPDLDDKGEPKVNTETGEPLIISEKFSLEGWRFAFSLELGLTLQERESNEYKMLGPKAGEYSLNALVVKFETAKFQPTESYFGKEDKTWASFSEAVQRGLKFVVGELRPKLLEKMIKTKTIGYALKDTAASTDKPKLTFTPNEIQYQTYPWVDKEAINFQPSVGLKGNQRLNYLLYCETTEDRKLPDINKRFLPRNGNWTDGRLEKATDPQSVEFGSFHMSRENFFDRYLLKKLATLNKALEPYMSRTYTKTDGVNPQWKFENDLSIGTSHTSDASFWDWKPTSDTTWEFKSSYSPKEDYDESGVNGWWSKVWANANCDCANKLSFEPGTDIIRVTGRSHIYYKFHYWERNNWKANTDETDELEWNIDWSMTLDLQAVTDGGLQISSEFVGPTVSSVKESLHRLNKFKDYTTNAMTTAIANADVLRKELAKDLEGKQGLVLPAGGVFFFKNPILSHRGDLICSVAYSRAAPSKMFDPNDNTVINEGGVSRLELSAGEAKALPAPPGSANIPKTSDNK